MRREEAENKNICLWEVSKACKTYTCVPGKYESQELEPVLSQTGIMTSLFQILIKNKREI